MIFIWKLWKCISILNKSHININNSILENLIPFINQKNITTLYAELHLSSAYGEIENDLAQTEEHLYRIISLPMESLAISLSNKIPFVYTCYTLFSHSQSSWNKINIDFKDIYILLQLDPYSMPIRQTMPMPIMMHSQNALPYENYNFVTPGYFYIIRYSLCNIERLGKGYETDCRKYNATEYTRSDCIFDCYQGKVKYHCQTEQFVGVNILRRKVYFEQSNLNLSKCIVNDKVHYKSLKSCEDQCHKECHFTYYSVTIDKYNVIDMYQARFIINHNEMPDITIRYIPEMPLLTFICNFGGILGMWLGISFYTILEIMWKIFRNHILSNNNLSNIFITVKNKFINTNMGNFRRVSRPRIH